MKRFWRRFVVNRKAQKSAAEFNSNTLNVSELAKTHPSLGESKIAQLLSSELGWDFVDRIFLNPKDLKASVWDVDKIESHNALSLSGISPRSRRLITWNPDLILSDGKLFGREDDIFQISTEKEILKAFDKFNKLKSLLVEVSSSQFDYMASLLLASLECFELGASRICFSHGRYVAEGVSGKYEGRVAANLLLCLRDVLVDRGEEIFRKLLMIINKDGDVELGIDGDSLVIKLAQELSSNPEPVSRLKHILLVDDDVKFVDLLKRGISLKGFRVSVANSAKQAIEYLQSDGTQVDLVICDYHMPVTSGASFIASMRTTFDRLPIIGLTGDTDAHSQVSFIGAGVNAIVRKSENPQVLFAWIFKLLEPDYKLNVI